MLILFTLLSTPEGSPATFCGVSNHVIYQHQQQQLLNVAASELVQALQAPGPLQQMQHKTSVDHSNAQQQQPMALDNVRLIMYSNNNNNEQHGAPVGGGVQQKIVGQQHGRGQARLPESPPITDLSGGGSSISPGSSGAIFSLRGRSQMEDYSYSPSQNQKLKIFPKGRKK